MLIDARGLGCPKPVIMAEEALSKISEGIVEVLVDNNASANNLKRFASKSGFYSETDRKDNHWQVKIVKGYPCETAPADAELAQSEETSKKEIFLAIGTDTLGKDGDLGKILMKGFLETMKVTKELPHTIFFLNAGVKLTTIEEYAVGLLKEMEHMGVSIYSCSTCLKHYGLEDKLRVGQAGGMFILIEGIKDFKKVVWI